MTDEQTPLLKSHHTSTSPSKQPNRNLHAFRLAIGINTLSLTTPSSLEAGKPPQPTGLYAQITSNIRYRRIQYHVIDILYYTILITQLLLGATIASLSSLSSLGSLHTSSISILGITNSFTAGILALLKGQGLPDRLRKDEYQMQRVRDWIEEIEARLAVGEMEGADDGWIVKAGGVEGLIGEAWDRYGTARDTSEMNRPSSYAHQVEGAAPELNGVADGKPSGRRAASNSAGTTKGKGKLVID